MNPVNAHVRAEERSIALHRAIAQRIREDPSRLERVRRRVAGWLEDGTVHPEYATAWAAILERPLDEFLVALVDPGERARALRQCTPFAGVLTSAERYHILRAERARQEQRDAEQR